MLETVQKVVPGTRQVQIVPLVTMGMVIVTWALVTFVIPDDVTVPEEVWGAVTGILIYGLQYWHGPRK